MALSAAVIVLVISDILNGFPRAWADKSEPDMDRDARMMTIAAAITGAAEEAVCAGAAEECIKIWNRDESELVSALVSLAFSESAFALHVHQGVCAQWECDHGLARGLWQIHPGGMVSQEMWDHMKGTDPDATLTAARGAVRVISAAIGACGSMSTAMGAWLSGKCSDGPIVHARYAVYRSVLDDYSRHITYFSRNAHVSR